MSTTELAKAVLRAKERYDAACIADNEGAKAGVDEAVRVRQIIERQRALQAFTRAEIALNAAIRAEPVVAMPTLEETIARMKLEIIRDRNRTSHNGFGELKGAVRDAKSFGDLHDYVDANEYGGFCEDELHAAMVAHFGGRDIDDGMPQEMVDFVDAAQVAIDTWIKSGEFAKEVARADAEVEAD